MSDVYEFIDAEYATRPAAPAITLMCRWLEVSKSGFYEWRSRPDSATAKRREELRLLVKKAFDDSDGTYGHRRVWAQLARWGIACGLELVRKLMRQLGLVPCQPRPWRPQTTQQGQAGPIPDLVNRDFGATVPGAKMVGDITYIPTWEGWVFLATVIDCASAVVPTEVVNESGTYTLDKRKQPLWQAVGLSADPGGYFDIVATVKTTAVTTGTGKFGVRVAYAN